MQLLRAKHLLRGLPRQLIIEALLRLRRLLAQPIAERAHLRLLPLESRPDRTNHRLCIAWHQRGRRRRIVRGAAGNAQNTMLERNETGLGGCARCLGCIQL